MSKSSFTKRVLWRTFLKETLASLEKGVCGGLLRSVACALKVLLPDKALGSAPRLLPPLLPIGPPTVPIVPAPAEIRCWSVRAARALTSSCALMHLGYFGCAVVELIATISKRPVRALALKLSANIVLPIFLKHSAPLQNAAGSYQSCREKCPRDSCNFRPSRLLILM